MYVKNNDFYFSKNDYLHFDKLKFTVYNSGTRRIASRNHYDYAIDMISLRSDYSIYIDFRREHKSDNSLKLLFTKDKHRSKMSLLYNLKCTVSSIYNALLLLCKQHVSIPKYNNMFCTLLHLVNERYNKDINLIKIYETLIDLIVNIDNPIKQENTIIIIEQQHHNNMLSNQIIIENNIIRTDDTTIIHFESCSCYCNKIITHEIDFYNYTDTFIAIKDKKYYISYYTPPSLLVKFINNVELFDNIDKVYINSECDMLKYI